MILMKALIISAIISLIIIISGQMVLFITDEIINYNNNTKKGDNKNVKTKSSKEKHR